MSRALVLAFGAWLLLSGCELVADFDRSKIVTDAGAEPEPDASPGPGNDAMIIFPDAAVDAASDEDAGF